MPLISITPATIIWPLEAEEGFRPSWENPGPGQTSEAPASLLEQAQRLAGSMGDRGGVELKKLYEAAFHNGGVVLEIGGEGPREGVMLLHGALRGMAMGAGRHVSQLYHIGISAKAILRMDAAMQEASLADHAMFFDGGLQSFLRQVPMTPTLVVVHGGVSYATVWAQLHELNTILAARTPVLYSVCDSEAMRALKEWVESGAYAALGRFGETVLLAATGHCKGAAAGLPAQTFAAVREALLREYREADAKGTHATARKIGDATSPARAAAMETAQRDRSYAARGWPFEKNESDTFPEYLPDGSPWPKISIVTPSFNYGRFLEGTILSVLHQDYPHVEYLVIDGGSTDETPAVIEKYRDRLTYAVSERDGGQSNAINKGFARATGDIFTWLNADDMLAPGALHAMALAFWYSQADLVAGVCERYRDDRLLEKHVTCCANGPLPLEELLDVEGSWATGQFFVQPEVMFTRAMWKRAGGHVEESLTYSMDYEMWLRFALAGAKLHVIGRSIALFRHHAEQKTAVPENFMPELMAVRDGFVATHGMGTGGGVAKKKVLERPRYQLRVASLHDPVYRSGAGIGQTRLDQAMCLAGHEVHRFAWPGEETEGGKLLDAEVVVKAVAGVAPDVVMVGTLAGTKLSREFIATCVERWPTCVVLHDLWAMRDEEEEVKGLPFPPVAACEIREEWERVYGSFGAGPKPVLLANSEWMATFVSEALDSQRPVNSPNSVPVFSMPYGVDLDTFCPLPKRWCRRELGLPEDRFLILTTATSLDESPAGIRLLAAALKQLMLPPVMVVCLGEADVGMREAFPSLRSLGDMRNSRQRAKAYAAVDVVAGIGREEPYAFAQMLTEAAACGTPSIAFPVGAMAEAVIDGVTGTLAATVSAEALAWEIYEFYRDGERARAMGKWGRLFAENEWSPERAYQRLHVALLVTGILERLGMPPKISLVPEPSPLFAPIALARHKGEWQPTSGFAPWEGPYPEQGLPRCRWLTGGVSELRIFVTHPGVHRIRIACSTFHPHAVLRLVHGGKLVAERVVTAFVADRGGAEPSVLAGEVLLEERSGLVELHHWPWDIQGGANGNSILLFELTVTGPDGRELPNAVTAVTRGSPSE